MEGMETIRETPFGGCIGARILDITTTSTEEFLAGELNHVYFHLDSWADLLRHRWALDGGWP